MSAKQKFLKDVLTALEIGAEGPFTKDKLEDRLKDRGVHLDALHLFGARGLFECNNEDGKRRLSLGGLNLLMSHRSIKQAKCYAIIAILIAAAALACPLYLGWLSLP